MMLAAPVLPALESLRRVWSVIHRWKRSQHRSTAVRRRSAPSPTAGPSIWPPDVAAMRRKHRMPHVPAIAATVPAASTPT
jgi:hypothetical protein